jgi:serine/threonine protein kinase
VTWEVKWSDLRLVKPLGEGAFGVVRLMALAASTVSPNCAVGRRCSSRGGASGLGPVSCETLVAVKHAADEDDERALLDEMQLMRRMRHPHLVPLLHTVTLQVSGGGQGGGESDRLQLCGWEEENSASFAPLACRNPWPWCWSTSLEGTCWLGSRLDRASRPPRPL